MQTTILLKIEIDDPILFSLKVFSEVLVDKMKIYSKSDKHFSILTTI